MNTEPETPDFKEFALKPQQDRAKCTKGQGSGSYQPSPKALGYQGGVD